MNLGIAEIVTVEGKRRRHRNVTASEILELDHGTATVGNEGIAVFPLDGVESAVHILTHLSVQVIICRRHIEGAVTDQSPFIAVTVGHRTQDLIVRIGIVVVLLQGQGKQIAHAIVLVGGLLVNLDAVAVLVDHSIVLPVLGQVDGVHIGRYFVGQIILELVQIQLADLVMLVIIDGLHIPVLQLGHMQQIVPVGCDGRTIPGTLGKVFHQRLEFPIHKFTVISRKGSRDIHPFRAWHTVTTTAAEFTLRK